MSRTLFHRIVGEHLGSPFRDRGPRPRGARDVELEVHSCRGNQRTVSTVRGLARPIRLY